MSTPILRTSAPSELSNPGLVLLWGNSPNGWKITYALQGLKESGQIPDYTVVQVFLQKDEQFQEWFVKLNPNSKMPVLIDNRRDKPPLYIIESGAILQYLARVYDKQYLYTFEDDDSFQEMINWIHLCQANLGPQQGQLNHFSRYTQVSCAYSLERFRTEVLRLYSVYESHLSTRPFLVGSKPSYADFCTQPWMRTLFWAGESIDQFPNIKAYVDRIEEMGFVKRALEIPERDLVSRVKGDVGVGGEDHGGDEESERGEREGEERSGYGGEGWKGMIGTQLE